MASTEVGPVAFFEKYKKTSSYISIPEYRGMFQLIALEQSSVAGDFTKSLKRKFGTTNIQRISACTDIISNVFLF